jgi:hypothetical protein
LAMKPTPLPAALVDRGDEEPQSLITSDNVYSRKQKFLQGRAVDEEPCR